MNELAPLARLGLDASAPASRVVAQSAQGTIDAASFARRVRAWTATFAAQKGSDYALYFEDAGEFAAALFGGWQAGKTLWLPGDALDATLQRLALAVHGFAGEVAGALTCAEATPSLELHALDPAACRLVLYTSGSSGEPTPIVKTLRQLETEIAALETQFGNRLDAATVQGTVSHQHIYGLLFRVLWPLAAGRPFATRRLAYPEQIAALADGACTLIASPAHLKRLPENLDWSAFSARLRTVFSSGGPLPPDAAMQVEALWGHRPVEVFGSTETGGIAWRAGGDAGGTWRALPGVEWRIADGALQIRAPHLPDLQWYTTQDRAEAAGEGFDLLGRADRIVKLEERRISLSAIERRVAESPLVDEARVLALPGARSLVAAVATMNDAGRALLAAEGKRALVLRLRDWLQTHVDPIALPRRWRFVETLPVDARGKTSLRALRDLFHPTLPPLRWHARSATQAELELEIEAELAVFDGHFPQAAVVPGVAMLGWVVTLAREAFGATTPCRRMESLKFQHVVRPGALLRLTMEWKAETRTLAFRIVSAHAMHASGRLVFDAGAQRT